jgi:hypothetical protein
MVDAQSRNVSLLALLLVVGVLVVAGLNLLQWLARLPHYMDRGGMWNVFVGGSAGLLIQVMYLLVIAVAYGVLLRFLALCDDIAAIRGQQTGTP